jgi:phenol 2-monooxygenase
MQSPVGSCLIIPRERGLVRLYVQLENRPELFDANGAIIREKVSSKMMLEVANASMKPYTIDAEGEPEWWSVYRSESLLIIAMNWGLMGLGAVRQGVAERYASPEGPHGRVFITGDACHTHSPKAGQGMNASINDSHNLGRYIKLRHARAALIQLYSMEARTCSSGMGQTRVTANCEFNFDCFRTLLLMLI